MGHFSLKEKGRIYLDHNGTTPLSEVVFQKITQWASVWGNPSSVHQTGRGPKALLRQARQQVAELIGSSPLEVIFTSGGSEANSLAIHSVYESLQKNKKQEKCRNQYILSAVEHPSVKEAFRNLALKGYQVDTVNVLPSGEIDLDHYESLLSDQTALVSIMLANNETGHIYPIKKLCKKAHDRGALFHCDAVQALGKIPLNVEHLGVDYASFSGHKFYALKGCGVLYMKSGSPWVPQIHGGGQERGRRAGTENILSIASFGEVAKLKDRIIERSESVALLRDELQDWIQREIPSVEIIAHNCKRLPNTLNLLILGVDAQTLLMRLDMEGFSVSTGSACSSGSSEPSSVLLAMGLSPHQAKSSLRVSLGWGNTKEELLEFAKTLKSVVQELRSHKDTFSGIKPLNF